MPITKWWGAANIKIKNNFTSCLHFLYHPMSDRTSQGSYTSDQWSWLNWWKSKFRPGEHEGLGPLSWLKIDGQRVLIHYNLPSQ